ncbi:twin-arginine translocase subunit TatC [Duncaniella freteri]|nr:twin-arginine translocase subunit TatC [Duncaniella freteri]
MLTFGGHLDVLRKMLLRILVITFVFSSGIFFFKDMTFEILLAPSEWNFITYLWVEEVGRVFISDFCFGEFHVDLIATDLSSQFMTHLTTSIYLGLLCASPFILIELFKFISPALLDSERRYSVQLGLVVYVLFVVGLLMSYYVLFPISFRFLGTYSVADKIRSAITIDSYISTFVTLSFLMGLVFQLPVIAFLLAKMGFVRSQILIHYRVYAFLMICIVSAIITPPDVMTLILVAFPLYVLYEIGIKIVKMVE